MLRQTRLPKNGHGSLRGRYDWSAYLFLAPSMLGYIVFVLIPLIMVIILSFQKYNIITPAVFNDAKNWIKLTLDKRFLMTLRNSFLWVLLLVPMHTIISIVLALTVSSLRSSKLQVTLRTVYYLPVLMSTACLAMVWTYIFNTNFGIFNYLLSLFNIEEIPWRTSSFWGYPMIMIFSLWKFMGLYFLLLLIGCQNIDKAILEAARIDGASTLQRKLRIELPLLTPTIFYILITQMIGTIQIFDDIYFLTGGGPGDGTRSLVLYIYNTAYQYQNYGYASAMSLVLFCIVLIITIVQFRYAKWVDYER